MRYGRGTPNQARIRAALRGLARHFVAGDRLRLAHFVDLALALAPVRPDGQGETGDIPKCEDASRQQSAHRCDWAHRVLSPRSNCDAEANFRRAVLGLL